MAEDLKENLRNYEIQLEQVEAALTSDPENEELLKLKTDLTEVLNLTIDLIKAQEVSTGDAAEGSKARTTSKGGYRVGDKVSAVWSNDGGYYPARINKIFEDGTCTVLFEVYHQTEDTQLSLLKPYEVSMQLKRRHDQDPALRLSGQAKRDKMAKEREYKKKKAEKKRARMKVLEEEREREKNKWKNFNSKIFSKTSKGKVKKSIFATPEQPEGRVGVGTCGIGGSNMTDFVKRTKWKKQ